MKTKELERCVHLVSNQIGYTEEAIREDIGSEISVTSKYITPFRKELNLNLSERDSFEGKSTIIRHYLWELRCQTEHEIVQALIFEIKYSCRKYNIDFLEICSDYNIAGKDFEDVVYLGFDEEQAEPTPPEKKESTLRGLFVEDHAENWQRFFDCFTLTEPALLKKTEGAYKFVGKPRGHIGIIGTLMQVLKVKGILKQNLDRDTIAKILSANIENYKIAGSSVTNTSDTYKDKFEDQFEDQLRELIDIS